jgi:hypothetical protein
MNRSRSVSETSVGLFAFLDVLMSTMGSLILVLMVVTPKIRQEAVAKVAAETQRAVESRHATELRNAVEQKEKVDKKATPYVPPPVIELPRLTVDLNARLKVQFAELSEETKEKRRIAQGQHEALGVVQASLQKSQAEIEELERQLAQIRRVKDRLADSVTKVSGEGVEIETQLARNRARLRKLRSQIAHESTEYTFVAYDGVSGTTRHPILIECTREHIKFLQEDVSLSSVDVTGYSPSYNPVLAGARALVDYWATHSPPGEPRPYVLLVVRPSGTIAYYTARRLLEQLKDPFGYELLPDDQKLNIPPPDPEAAEVCRKAVQKAIAERVDVFKEVFGNGTGSGRGGKLAGASGSGNDRSGKSRTPNGGIPSPFDDPDGTPNQQPGVGGATSGTAVAQSETGSSGAASTRNGAAANGTSDTPPSGQPGSGTATSRPGGPGPGQPGNATASNAGEPGSGPNAGRSSNGRTTDTGSQGSGSPGNNSSIAGAPGGGSPMAGSPGSGSPGSGSPVAGSSGSGSPDGAPSESGFATTRPSGTGETGTESAVSPSRSEFPPAIVPRSGTGDTPNSGVGSERLTVGRPTPGSAGNETSDGQPQGSAGQAGGLDSATFASGSPAGSTRSGSTQPGGFLSGGDSSGAPGVGGAESGSAGSGPAQLQAPELGSTQSGSQQGGSPQADSEGQPDSGQAGGSPSFGSSSSSASGADGGQPSQGSDSPSKAMDGLPSFTTSSDDNDAPHRPNRQTTHQWGIASPRASIGYEHDVTVYIEARRICVGGQPPILCGRGEISDQLSFAFLRALDKEARTWGRPRENFYWVPNLRIAISPGGILQYERIQPALLRHGLSSTVDYRLELSRPAPMPSLVTE